MNTNLSTSFARRAISEATFNNTAAMKRLHGVRNAFTELRDGLGQRPRITNWSVSLKVEVMVHSFDQTNLNCVSTCLNHCLIQPACCGEVSASPASWYTYPLAATAVVLQWHGCSISGAMARHLQPHDLHSRSNIKMCTVYDALKRKAKSCLPA